MCPAKTRQTVLVQSICIELFIQKKKSLKGNDIIKNINAKHRCQEFSLSIQIWNAKFALALSVNWVKSYLGSLSLRWLKFSFTESPADSFNFIGQQP